MADAPNVLSKIRNILFERDAGILAANGRPATQNYNGKEYFASGKIKRAAAPFMLIALGSILTQLSTALAAYAAPCARLSRSRGKGPRRAGI
jgi:hypothetical protein